MWMAWLLTATASDLDASWYLAYTGRPEAAAAEAAASIRADVDRVEAHRLYAWSRAQGLREGPQLERQYAEWLADGGEDPARLTLGWVLAWRNPEPGPWCEDLASLMVEPFEDPVDRYWAARLQLETSAFCGGDPRPLIDELLELGDELPLARGTALELAMIDGLVDSVLRDAIRSALAEDGWSMLSVLGLWQGAQGPKLEEAQAEVLELARQQATSEEAHLVWAAIQVLGTAGDMESVGRASEHLVQLDPAARRAPSRATAQVSWLGRPLEQGHAERLSLVAEAANHTDPKVALRELKRVGTYLAVDGTARQAWHLEISACHARLGQDKRAFRALRDAWTADPHNTAVANQFAYTAALRGDGLDAALLAIDETLAQPIRWDPRGDHPAPDYGVWRHAAAAERGAWLDTRGWVLHAMGRDTEAALDLERALLHAGGDASVLHLHLGLVYAALGKESLALDHLGRGLVLDEGEEPRLSEEARAEAERLFGANHWSATGLEGWLRSLGLAEPPDTEAGQPSPDEDPFAGPLVGQPMPDLAYFVDSEPTFLSATSGWRVIELWATWCAPCVESWPQMQEFATSWRDQGLTVIAISVDDDPAQVDEWLQDHTANDMTVGWIGPAGPEELGLESIPMTLLVDPDGLVRAQVRGWGGAEDHRLEEALDRLLPLGSSPREDR